MSDDDIHRAMTLMSTGEMGGFARRLAEAWFVADSGNRAKIENTWADLIERAAHFSR